MKLFICLALFVSVSSQAASLTRVLFTGEQAKAMYNALAKGDRVMPSGEEGFAYLIGDQVSCNKSLRAPIKYECLVRFDHNGHAVMIDKSGI